MAIYDTYVNDRYLMRRITEAAQELAAIDLMPRSYFEDPVTAKEKKKGLWDRLSDTEVSYYLAAAERCISAFMDSTVNDPQSELQGKMVPDDNSMEGRFPIFRIQPSSFRLRRILNLFKGQHPT